MPSLRGTMWPASLPATARGSEFQAPENLAHFSLRDGDPPNWDRQKHSAWHVDRNGHPEGIENLYCFAVLIKIAVIFKTVEQLHYPQNMCFETVIQLSDAGFRMVAERNRPASPSRQKPS